MAMWEGGNLAKTSASSWRRDASDCAIVGQERVHVGHCATGAPSDAMHARLHVLLLLPHLGVVQL
jgi:hypothetical protein